MNLIQTIKKPPTYCHYADGPCDQDFPDTISSEGVFLYPAKPQTMAHTKDLEKCLGDHKSSYLDFRYFHLNHDGILKGAKVNRDHAYIIGSLADVLISLNTKEMKKQDYDPLPKVKQMLE